MRHLQLGRQLGQSRTGTVTAFLDPVSEKCRSSVTSDTDFLQKRHPVRGSQKCQGCASPDAVWEGGTGQAELSPAGRSMRAIARPGWAPGQQKHKP